MIFVFRITSTSHILTSVTCIIHLTCFGVLVSFPLKKVTHDRQTALPEGILPCDSSADVRI